MRFNYFARDSLEIILAGFNTTIERLHALAEQNRGKATINDSKVRALLDENQALIAESSQADVVAWRLAELIKPKEEEKTIG